MARKWTPATDEELARQNEQALREAREAERVEPQADFATYDPERGLVIIGLKTGIEIGLAPERVPGLAGIDAARISEVRVSPSGDGLHWDVLDVHASLAGLLVEALALREWAPRIMGQRTSEAKALAARLNGQKGGRPRKSATPATPRTRRTGS